MKKVFLYLFVLLYTLNGFSQSKTKPFDKSKIIGTWVLVNDNKSIIVFSKTKKITYFDNIAYYENKVRAEDYYYFKNNLLIYKSDPTSQWEVQVDKEETGYTFLYMSQVNNNKNVIAYRKTEL